MKILPSYEEIQRITADGTYKICPVSCEMLSDICTPIEALKILKNISTHCYMLESVTEKEKWGRYTFLGFDPKMEITCLDGEMKAGDLTFKTENPSAYLRQILQEYKTLYPSDNRGKQKPQVFQPSALYRRPCRIFLL